MTNTTQERILRLPEVKTRTGMGRTSIYLKTKEGSFPKYIRLGKRSIGWIESEIDNWVAQTIAANRFDQ